MPQDAYMLNFLCKELNALLKNSKVNKIVQADNDRVVLTLYTGVKTEKLLIDINPGSPRIGVIKGDLSAPLTAPNFCMLLRKHLLNAVLNSIEIVPFDRIVKITFTASSDFFEDTEKTLFIELMGRYSNVVLTQNRKVLGGNRGINLFDNGIRPLIVGKPYCFPPSNNKLLPNDKALIDIFGVCETEPISAVIFKNVQGISLDTAKEIESEYYKKHSSFSKETLFEFLGEFVFGKEVKPCVYMENGTVKDVCALPFNTISGDVKYFDSLTLAEEFYFEEKEKNKNFKNLYQRILGILSSKISKAKKRLSAIIARERDCNSLENNKIFGELILSNIYKIKNGDISLTALNYYNGQEVTISLDGNLTPSQNAERYFKKYNKQKRTLIALKPQKENAEKELNYLNSVFAELEIAEDVLDLKLILEELTLAGIVEVQKNQKKNKERELLTYNYLGFIIKVGKNNAENDKITSSAKSEDVWLHVKDYHSSHVVIETNGKSVPEKVVKFSAEICAYYSKCRNSEKIEVVYALKKHVKKPPKSPLGFCIYENFKSIIVNPNKHQEILGEK